MILHYLERFHFTNLMPIQLTTITNRIIITITILITTRITPITTTTIIAMAITTTVIIIITTTREPRLTKSSRLLKGKKNYLLTRKVKLKHGLKPAFNLKHKAVTIVLIDSSARFLFHLELTCHKPNGSFQVKSHCGYFIICVEGKVGSLSD